MRKCCMDFYFFSHWFIFSYWKKSRAVEVGGDGGETGLQVKLCLEECWWVSEWARVTAIMAQLHSQRVFLLVPSTRNKNEPRAEPIPDSSLHSSAVFTMTTGPTRWTIHAFPSAHSHMEIKGNTALEDNGHSFRFSHTLSSEMFKTEGRAALDAEASFWSEEWTDEKQAQIRLFSIGARCMIILTLMVITGLRIHLSY